MFILLMLAITLVVWYLDAIVCAAVGHAFNWKTSLLCAIFWPVTIPLTIMSVVNLNKESK